MIAVFNRNRLNGWLKVIYYWFVHYHVFGSQNSAMLAMFFITSMWMFWVWGYMLMC